MFTRKSIDSKPVFLFGEAFVRVLGYGSLFLLLSLVPSGSAFAAENSDPGKGKPVSKETAPVAESKGATDAGDQSGSVPEETSAEDAPGPEGKGATDTEGEGTEAEATGGSGEAGDVEEVEAVEVDPFASPEEAMVAVRGDSSVGLGALTHFDEKPVVVTTLSSLVGSRRIVVNTADGIEVPIVGIVGVYGTDLAFLAVNDEGLELPFCRMKLDADLEPNESVTILSPREKIDAKLGAESPGRYSLSQVDGPVYSGSPVAVGKQLVGVYSPSRVLSTGSSGKGQSKVIWEAGVVPFFSKPSWEAADLSTLALEEESLEEVRMTLEQVSSLLGVGGKGDLTMQRLISARDRLADGLARASQEVEKDSARRRFVFSVRSTAGTVASVLEDAEYGYSSYFLPEVVVLTEMYAPVAKKIQAMSENPRSADSFAR